MVEEKGKSVVLFAKGNKRGLTGKKKGKGKAQKKGSRLSRGRFQNLEKKKGGMPF